MILKWSYTAKQEVCQDDWLNFLKTMTDVYVFKTFFGFWSLACACKSSPSYMFVGNLHPIRKPLCGNMQSFSNCQWEHRLQQLSAPLTGERLK